MGGAPCDLSKLGQDRAAFIAEKFQQMDMFLPLAEVFTADPHRPPYQHREALTVQPLAQSLSLPFHANYSADAQEELIQAVLSSRWQRCGRSAIISWEHCHIPSLLQSLGCQNNEVCRRCWADEDFSSVVRLRWISSPDGWAPVVVTGDEGFNGCDAACQARNKGCQDKAIAASSSSQSLFSCYVES